ncbi:DBF4-type zinc finger-containing protein 2 [Gastrophryne carolinensis]
MTLSPPFVLMHGMNDITVLSLRDLAKDLPHLLACSYIEACNLSLYRSGNAQVQEPSGSGLPPGYFRQGYCSCCQVHYINLEKHLAGDQHKQISSLHRNRVSTSMLMERFLQDVHLYHPQKYHDYRPTHDDIPDVNLLSSSHEDNSSTLLHPPQATVPRRTLTGCASGSCKLKSTYKTFTQSCNTNPEENQGPKNKDHQQSDFTLNSSLTTCQEALSKTVNKLPHTIHYSTLPLYSTSHVTTNHTYLESPHSVLCSGSSKNRDTIFGKCKPGPSAGQESPKKTLQNRRCNLQGSYYHLTSGTPENKRMFKAQEDNELIFGNHILPNDSNKVKDEEYVGVSHLKNKKIHLKKEGNSVDETIERVIKKYCPKDSPERIPVRDDESVFSVNVPSVTACTEKSCLSFEWNIPLELKNEPPKVNMTNIDFNKECMVNIDEEYTSKLKCALSVSPTKDIESIKPEHDQEVLQALPHIPPSFVGKTWSQVMYEDDLKIEALVNEFKRGKFHCYFEEEYSMKTGTKRKHKNKHVQRNVEAKTEDLDESQKLNVLPLFEDDFCEDHHPNTYSIKSEQIVKPKVPKPCRRVWRQASRCQVVKVSHGTQTSLVNFPVVKRKILRNESHQSIFDNLWEERTPEMKTRMCALKLPESYTKILTPVQPKTMIYVLSHPELKLSSAKRSRNRCSTDSRDSVYFKYKQSPLKYYDPLTNRILKTPPRNSVRGKSSKALCVRKLFKSLTSDGNVDKIDSEQKESSSSKKSLSSCSIASLNIETVKGNYFTSTKKDSRSSLSSEHMDSSYEQKSGQPEKAYKHITISPYKADRNKVKDDAQNNILMAKSKSKPMRPQRVIVKEPSARRCKIVESRIATRSNHNPHRVVKNLEKQTKRKTRPRKQSKSKSSSIPSKSNRPFAQAYQQNVKKDTRHKNDRSVTDHKKRLVKSIKPSKTKQGLTKDHFQNKYQDRNTNARSSRKSSQLFVQNTKHYLRSRHKVTNMSSATRTFTNTLKRRNVR